MAEAAPSSPSTAHRWACRAARTAPSREDIAFSVGAGEIVCVVVGESGSGKSVTAQAVMGPLPRELSAAAGRLRLEGEDVLKATPARLRDLRAATRMAADLPGADDRAQPIHDGRDQIAEVLESHAAIEPDRRQRG
jgi:peptide/nickel transport system ATP-binding protein